ncbi:LysR family transcriptional regulator [Pseudomonas guariconensis]|uniref:LysR family transcriptional regulator n=1 Tax=Pseudomonas guariconensis TaxID=1288410 RepID=UPI0018A9F9D5|nr:LysR family transcriptional regulator [Pseudomonas guariconensis]MBF8740611.1 LysR family transcriptional regulator [Pseudomonas guariconensis]MBF8749791.1 LysR family transcriptional regulator [Pseudomonas guariconensis]
MDLLAAMRIYVRVVERGNMSSAARDLDMRQPTISERIDKLERFLGKRLLMRSARTLLCTDEGVLFYERSKVLLLEAEAAIAAVDSLDDGMSGKIRIAAPQCLGETLVPKLLMQMNLAYPKLRVDLILNDSIVDLVTEGVDISLRLGTLGEGSFVAHPIGVVERILVASPTYLAQHGGIEKQHDLINHPFIRVKGILANERLPLVSADGILEQARIRTHMTVSHWRPMFEMLVAGGGIGVLQHPACVDALAQGSLIRLLPEYSVQPFALNMLQQPRRPSSQRVETILAMIKAQLPDLLGSVEHVVI